MNSESKKALEEFLLDIDILDKLKVHLNQFNIFDILKISKTEIRHSNVLSWLLNPKENHGLDDVFLRKFLQDCIKTSILNNNICTLDLMNVSLMDYSDIIVNREWNNIDILIVSKNNKTVICIENKTFSKESKHQLKKYLNTVNRYYPDYNKIFVFLTPDGNDASDTDNWISFNYNQIVSILEQSIELKKDYINVITLAFLQQYIQIIRRELLMDEELISICTDIYKKHKKALDLIFEYKEDSTLQIKNILEESLNQYDDIVIDSSNKTYVRFISKAMDSYIEKHGVGWVKSGRVLLYEFQNRNDKLTLKLIIGPTKDESSEIKEKIFEISNKHQEVFKGRCKTLSPKFTQIYAVEVASKDILESDNLDAIKSHIEGFIHKFINNDMKTIDDILKELL